MQVNNIIIVDYGTVGVTKYGLLIQRGSGATIKNVEICNVDVKNGLGNGAEFGILSSSDSTNFIENLTMNNIIASNGLYSGVYVLGNYHNINFANCIVTGMVNAGFTVAPNIAACTIDNLIFNSCQSLKNNTGGGTGDGFYFYLNNGAINNEVMLGCVSSGNRYGITAVAMVKKLKVDQSTQIVGNTAGDYNTSSASFNYASAAPTTNTWSQGETVNNIAPAGWVCVTSGTFGTLNSGSTNGSITSGTNSLTVNYATGLIIGQYITIAGVTGVKKITAISGTTITINSNADATVTNAAVAYSAPVFKGFGVIQS